MASASGSASMCSSQNALQPGLHVRRTDAAEVEPLEAAQDRSGGLRDLLRVGRREYEHDARRRFLQNLEQRVPGLAREHVRFVDDVHLVAAVARRGVHGSLAELPRVVDAAIGRGVDLNDVEAGRTTPDALTGVTHAAGLTIRRAILAVERHRQHACECRLPDPARSAQQIPVRDSSAGDGALERVRDVRLYGDGREVSRAILARESQHCDRERGTGNRERTTEPRQYDGASLSAAAALERGSESHTRRSYLQPTHRQVSSLWPAKRRNRASVPIAPCSQLPLATAILQV